MGHGTFSFDYISNKLHFQTNTKTYLTTRLFLVLVISQTFIHSYKQFSFRWIYKAQTVICKTHCTIFQWLVDGLQTTVPWEQSSQHWLPLQQMKHYADHVTTEVGRIYNKQSLHINVSKKKCHPLIIFLYNSVNEQIFILFATQNPEDICIFQPNYTWHLL